MKVGARIKKLRTDQAMTQVALAKKAKITQGYLSELEAGNETPSLASLQRLAKVLGCKMSELVE
jgi:transcriptional regulator with XRE-family HTH domain